MKNNSNNTALIILLVLTFPIWIGLAGGAFGLLAGIFGVVIGLIAGVFGILAGLIGAIFGFFGSIFSWTVGETFSLTLFPFSIAFNPFVWLALAFVIALVLHLRKQSFKKAKP